MSPDFMQVVLMSRARVRGPMLHVCPAPGCSTITMGGTCVEHDAPVRTVFPRGRPFVPSAKNGELRLVGDPLRDAPA